jgi:hypothetical protein
VRTSVGLSESAHEASRLFQSITGRSFSDIVNELLPAEVDRQNLARESTSERRPGARSRASR